MDIILQFTPTPLPNDLTQEQEMVALMQSATGMERGFRLLMQTYQERLYWHIRGFVQTHEDTDEVLQNTFVKVYRGIHQFRNESRLFTWLYRIATNESLTFLKKTKKQNLDLSLDDEHTNIGNTLSADTNIDSKYIQKILDKAIAQLPDKQRIVFNMRYYEELSYAEISNLLGTSEGALKASYHHAIKKIEQYIKPL
jgi:RNA polymerase sigma factor (sigma-70 family)